MKIKVSFWSIYIESYFVSRNKIDFNSKGVCTFDDNQSVMLKL